MPNKPDYCRDCPLYQMPGPVGAEGDPATAKFIYIAQNPAAEEVAAGGPLKGPSGRVFNRQLFESGVHRHEIYITNQVKCMTPRAPGGFEKPPAKAIAMCARFLYEELARVKADTVVLAGQVAWDFHIGKSSCLSPRYSPPNSIMQRMGCVEQKDGRKWIGTIHPAFIMRMPMLWDAPIAHLRKAWAISGQKIPIPKVISRPSEADVRRHAEAARDRRFFADDVETEQQMWKYDVDEDDFIGSDYGLTMCGFSAVDYEAIILPPARIPEWDPVWRDPNVTLFEHNGEYDRYHLEKVCDALALESAFDPTVPKNKRHDTCLGQHYLHNNMRKALKPYCVSLYTNLPYYGRDLGKVDEDLYCGMDNISTLAAGLEQRRQMANISTPGPPFANYLDLFDNLGMPQLPIYEMQRRVGCNTDVRKAMLFQRILQMKLGKGEELITRMLGPHFNWHSPDQVKELFYKKWGLPTQYKTVDLKPTKKDPGRHGKGKVITTDAKARVQLTRWIEKDDTRKAHYKPALTYFKLAEFVSETKKLLDYFSRISPDNRIHAYWKPFDETFRLASVPNIQNWPTWSIGTRADGSEYGSLRSIVIPDNEDDLLIATDFDQVELWTYAKIFNIAYLLSIYQSGDYVYGAAYEDVFGRSFFQEGKPRKKKYRAEYVTDEDLLRAKAIPLGFLYGREGESVAAEHGWPADEGRRYRAEWYGKNPELPAAHSTIKYWMTQRKQLQPPPGFLLHYPHPSLQGINCFGQTPAFAMLAWCMIELERQFAARGWKGTRTVLSVHDSILTNVRHGRSDLKFTAQVYNEVIYPTLTRPVPWLDGFQYRHEMKVGHMWDWDMVKSLEEMFTKYASNVSSSEVH
jgi:uracil-DNA glycosylase family 4